MTDQTMTGNGRSGAGFSDPAGLLFVATVFVSAALVFLVQPMFARMATPLLGGSPNVWNVSLVCFQAALLAGYAYAHLLVRLVKAVRHQVAVHGALLLFAALVLPFELSGLLGPPDPQRPALWLIGVFGVSIAPPFAIISATAPLVQAWYARTGRADAHDPYHLYAASNAGSLLGLAAYPLLLEPLAPLAVQAGAWSIGYGALCLMLIGCGLAAARGPGLSALPASVEPALPEAGPRDGLAAGQGMSRWRQRLWWLVLAFVPSSLLLGATTHIATDVASAPFLWAPPLFLYIASFVIVFAREPIVTSATMRQVVPLLAGLALFSLSKASGIPTLVTFGVHLLALFAVAVGCHGLLAESRPEAGRLTEFYLIMSLGGVLGGAFNALAAPVIFNGIVEYPMMLVAAVLLMPNPLMGGFIRTLAAIVIAVVAAILAFSVPHVDILADDQVRTYFLLLVAGLVAVCLGYVSRIASVAAALALWGIVTATSPTTDSLHTERGFFGVVRIQDRLGYRLMVHGTTLHGAQSLNPEEAWRPATYYAPETPIGQVFNAHIRPGRAAMIGLGVGSVACYAWPEQEYVFFEIDPIVARIASDPNYFTFISDCAPESRIVLGDGRLTLAEEPDESFDLVLVDAFSSDSIPAHLLTREAVELYLSKIGDDGAVLIHVSNRYLALETVVARIAADLGVPARVKFESPDNQNAPDYRAQASGVVALARTEEALTGLNLATGWTNLEADGGRPWTDDYSNIPGAMWDRVVHKKR
ncbi:spermidine synthase [Hyphomonas sp.]|uniref:spermidine synthase n=1 Tax=Hyphomonas sp. TaxID=87 RepID=UPI00391D0C92